MSVYMVVCVFMYVCFVCVCMCSLFYLQVVLPKLICERVHLDDLKASVFKNWAF